jgi:CheY-like chemotaxis protein
MGIKFDTLLVKAIFIFIIALINQDINHINKPNMQQLRLNLPLLYNFSRLYNQVDNTSTRIRNTLVILMALIGKQSLNILLADDDVEDREIFTSAIKELSSDVEVRTSVNGKELMEMLHNEDSPLPDILFLDLNMPFKNGQECLHEIRSTERLRKLPVIIYSTSASREYIDQTYNSGANYYLPKPDSFRDLKLIAEKIFSLDWSDHSRPQKEKFVLSAKYFK